ncbi:MAG: sulfatase-like hydrolase/transferase [Pseudomonadota bacterium]
MNTLTILICTHNRAALLMRAIASLNTARRPDLPIRILVAANACSDDTGARLEAYRAEQTSQGWLPLEWFDVPTPGKSHALNAAIPRIETTHVAFVDDDHRVDPGYLAGIEAALSAWPDAGLYCGRILPDWDGGEPAWVHDEGPYRIYPLPVPRYDQGDTPRTINADEGPIPGGGNLVVHRRVFDLTGLFSTELGPHGHDLGGGEDSEYVLRALERGERCQYSPGIVQHHYVDNERLKLGYLLKKSYQRTRSTSRIHGGGGVPLFMWRKLAEYAFHSLFSLGWAKRRFFWVRLAAALGEVRGRSESGFRDKRLDLPPDQGMVVAEIAALVAVAGAVLAWVFAGATREPFLAAVGVPALLGALALLTKSSLDFTQTGPRIREEVLTHYRRYTLFALIRLTLAALAILLWLAGLGVAIYFGMGAVFGWAWSGLAAGLAGVAAILAGVVFQLMWKLRFNPGLLVASMHYRISRLYPLWRQATPVRLRVLRAVATGTLAMLLVAALWQLARTQRLGDVIALSALALFYLGSLVWASWQPEARPVASRRPRPDGTPPNIVMIGSDTLRADRLGALGYRRALTPHIDALAQSGALFANCYVPCARTAPSLISMMTGTWPRTHGIRDNFVGIDETRLKADALPTLLRSAGYRSAVISDWCGADMGKFSFGFDHTDLPEDQWNLKFLIRQGPKDLRLFISLFAHNRLGRLLLPELYYLGGVPLTQPMGKRARRLLSRLAQGSEPFFLNIFYSTTHPPFATEWPWYTRYADPDYDGESKFAMARLTDPFEIIRRQGAPREEFDLDQILDLYDGSVAEFDDEVGKLLAHLDECGLADRTIVVVYSDHGMEFFEHDTWGQGNSAVGEASPRIPLVIRDPRLPAQGRIDHVVRSIDLAPTLLDLAGIETHAPMDGVSLAGCLADAAQCPELDAFNETGIWIADVPGLPDNHLRYPDLLELIEIPQREHGTLAIKHAYCSSILAAKDRMLRRGRWKLVYQPLADGERLQLFDLQTDPECRVDLSASHPDIARSLRQALIAWVDAPSSTIPPGLPYQADEL